MIKVMRILKHPKKPVTKKDCEEFANVLPSARNIAGYKHLQASKIECDAGVALEIKESSIKVTQPQRAPLMVNGQA